MRVFELGRWEFAILSWLDLPAWSVVGRSRGMHWVMVKEGEGVGYGNCLHWKSVRYLVYNDASSSVGVESVMEVVSIRWRAIDSTLHLILDAVIWI
jgi:hypothetical protein